MIRPINAGELDAVLTYLERDLQLCLYAYIDIKKYGFANPNLSIYAHFDEDGQIKCVIMQYFQGLQIYTADTAYNADELVAFLETLEFNMINGADYLIDAIVRSTADIDLYDSETGNVVELLDFSYNKDESVAADITQAETYDDFYASAKLICSDQDLGGHYEVAALADQLQTRQSEDFGRDFMLREDGNLICHAATYAELDNVGVISGVITDASARGRGLAYQVVGSLGETLLNEGKRVFLFYYTETAGRLYKKLGFTNDRKWKKLIVR